MSLYLDTSVLVPLFIPEPVSERATEFVASNREGLIISDLAVVEFSSAVARRVRTADTTVTEARNDFADFDRWAMRSALMVQIGSDDLAAAAVLLRRMDLALAALDALHVAMAQRLGAALVTFDRQMAASAAAIGLAVVPP